MESEITNYFSTMKEMKKTKLDVTDKTVTWLDGNIVELNEEKNLLESKKGKCDDTKQMKISFIFFMIMIVNYDMREFICTWLIFINRNQNKNKKALPMKLHQ